METETIRKLFTVDQYYQMADAGILAPDDRVELIDGEIIEMCPIGGRHLGCVNLANRIFNRTLVDRAVVSVQNPLQLSDYLTQADVVLLKPRTDCYAGKKPFAEDALLVVEVAETSLRSIEWSSCGFMPRSKVPEVWIENLKDDVLLVYRDPVGSIYATSLSCGRSDTISPLAFPDVAFQVADLLG